MFGIEKNLRDHSLYSLHDTAEELIESTEKELLACAQEDLAKKKILKDKIIHFKSEKDSFEEKIEKQRETDFQFSKEEIYSMYGQYDRRFISIEFHKFSVSALKFGRNISGCIKYDRHERNELEELIQLDSIPRTNGIMKLEVSEVTEISEELKQSLLDDGFLSGDIYTILSPNIVPSKSFGKAGKKEIPNTIEVKFDSKGFDRFFAMKKLYSDRVKKGNLLTEFEWHQLAAYTCIYEPEEVESMHDKVFNESGDKYDEVRLEELKIKLQNLTIKEGGIQELGRLFAKQRLSRVKVLEREISRSTTKKLKDFESDYPNIYKELIESTVSFNPESLVIYGAVKPIYLDYQRFVHIYLKHCNEFGIEGKFEKEGTKFQYTPKDIKRVLKIVIEDALQDINKALSEGKDYRGNGRKLTYFNGNHYSFHISKEGRVMAFHAMENPTPTESSESE